uniref:Uncharacterized protein n=1 Tax=Arundo donax TaxID=35708 RepID=A0A0A9DRX9_ARUDO
MVLIACLTLHETIHPIIVLQNSIHEPPLFPTLSNNMFFRHDRNPRNHSRPRHITDQPDD